MKKKICKKCGLEKEFKRYPGGKKEWVCRPCEKKRSREYTRKNKEYLKSKREKNKDKINRRKRELYRDNLEHHRELNRMASKRFRKNSPEKRRTSEEKWRSKNPKKRRQYARNYYYKNKDKCRKYHQKYHEINPEKRPAQMLIHYSLKTGVIKKPKFCEKCGEDKVLQGHHMDYSKPLDVLWLCPSCHKAVHMIDRLKKKENKKLWVKLKNDVIR